MLILFSECKDSERRAPWQIENEVFRLDMAEPHPVLCKDSERRAPWQIGNEVFRLDMAEPSALFPKDIFT